ncbi:MAG: YHS domain-containing protein [Sedimentisphaerales bacterium]|nr:YHS domain-containing protein [Sedimentisphaerales bacterium]
MMTTRMKIWTMFFVAITLSMGLLLFNGCKKSENNSSGTAQETKSHQGHDQMAMEAETAADTDSTIEQKTCPVMGGAINKELFVEYKGKKVYFCCAGCEEQFQKEPEKYIAKLPQFKQ